ncbi:hypothetical protein [Allobaculum mucilyticum]|uniref:hypothetical protein n=1 Tax=Allobaculum mucilyticum TaxID=2834459 RepID=UPI001E4E9AFA|nr:hypothetical protein [Allobaculum mucilyticum]UNT96220.1 hypothetical protein KWG62_00195 [Allobaculum mucilyticum]
MPSKTLLILDELPQLSDELLRNCGWNNFVRIDSASARRYLASSSADLIAVKVERRQSAVSPLVQELCALHKISGLILCPPELVDTLSYQMRSVPILVLPLNTAKTILIQVLTYLCKSVEEARRLSESLSREKKKAQDEKFISQVKVELALKCRWSEEKAHQFILKTAMDHSMTKVAAARQILARLERITSESKKDKRNASA